MPLTPDQPFPKKQGDNIRSKDWNDAVNEIIRLDSAKLNLAGGGSINGPLSVSGNLGVGADDLKSRLEVRGAANIWGEARYAVPNNFMAPGSLTIGSTSKNFGGGSGWNGNTAGLLLETQDNTEIAVHDAAHRIASLMYYEGGSVNRLSVGRDMGWGALGTLSINGNVGLGMSDPGFRLDVGSRIRLREGDGTGSAGLWLWQAGPKADRAFIGMASDTSVGFWGNTGANWGIVMDTTSGNVGIGTTVPQSKLTVVGDISTTGELNIASTLRSAGRMHITGGELLYLLHKAGVIVSKAWGGTGDIRVEGNILIGEWSISVSGASMFFRRGGYTVARLSTDWDRFIVYKNLNGAAPYFYFNQEGGFGRYDG